MTTGYHLHHVNGVVNKMDKTRGGVFKCAAKPTHKVILNGDSHLKGLAKKLQSVLNIDYKVIGIVKPGAGSIALSETVTETVKHLIKDDVMVISSGTNDQNLDNYKSTFRNFREYLTLTIHTNILVLGIPYIFDMQNSKEVNSKIFRLNRKLSKLVYSFPNTSFLEANNDNKLYTNHGLHRNKSGKQQIVNQVASHIFSIFRIKPQATIPLNWYEPDDKVISKDICKENEVSVEIPNMAFPKADCTTNTKRNLSRQRKIPVTRSTDFFMVNTSRCNLVTDLTDKVSNSYPNTSCGVKDNINFKSSPNTDMQNSMSLVTGKTKRAIFHQNIRGLSNKVDELLFSLTSQNPHVLCLTEHHLKLEEINLINSEQHTFGAYYCRRHFKQGGVAILTLKNTVYRVVSLKQCCKEKDIEICTLKLFVKSVHLFILCIYRSPAGKFSHFLTQLEKILRKLYSVSGNIILCRDFIVNFDANMIERSSITRASALKSLLHSFGLEGTVNFHTRGYVYCKNINRQYIHG